MNKGCNAHTRCHLTSLFTLLVKFYGGVQDDTVTAVHLQLIRGEGKLDIVPYETKRVDYLRMVKNRRNMSCFSKLDRIF